MAQNNLHTHRLIAPVLTAVPQTHGQVMDEVKTLERTLSALVVAQDTLLCESKKALPSGVMVALARQNCGGRVYLRWRWRFGTRGFFDLLEHVHQFDQCQHDVLFDIEDLRQSINYATSTTQHAYQRMIEFKTNQARLRPLRSRSTRPTSAAGSSRFSNQLTF